MTRQLHGRYATRLYYSGESTKDKPTCLTRGNRSHKPGTIAAWDSRTRFKATLLKDVGERAPVLVYFMCLSLKWLI